ncbi:MAG: hypothetical protein K2X81_27505, partial [Candidatus Obscuribacterales bacterium]|nr:hypothetical protein [Candidatus Obscuribacterales bacterium]
MKVLSSLLAFVLVSLSGPAFAQNEDKEGFEAGAQGFQSFESSQYCMQVRGGGNSGKALGVYRPGCKTGDIVFHSKEYLELSPELQARWAVSLQMFLRERRGGYINMLVYAKRLANLRKTNSDSAEIPDAIQHTYVSYKDLEIFTDMYFERLLKIKYTSLWPMFKDWFHADAISDGVNLIGAMAHFPSMAESLKAGEPRDLDACDLWTAITLDCYKRKITDEKEIEATVAAARPEWNKASTVAATVTTPKPTTGEISNFPSTVPVLRPSIYAQIVGQPSSEPLWKQMSWPRSSSLPSSFSSSPSPFDNSLPKSVESD